MLMGDTPEIPWRLLNIEFLMEDYETGGKESFCTTCSHVLIISILLICLSYFKFSLLFFLRPLGGTLMEISTFQSFFRLYLPSGI